MKDMIFILAYGLYSASNFWPKFNHKLVVSATYSHNSTWSYWHVFKELLYL